VTNLLPAIESALATGQESMRVSVADAASVKIVGERNDDAIGKRMRV
jgi:hypothetical protein